MLTPKQELDRYLDRRATVFFQAMMNLLHAHFGRGDVASARRDLAEVIQRTLILSDLQGRRRLLMEADATRRRMGGFAAVPETSPIVPGVPFEEAVEDILQREPRLERTAAEVARLYSTERAFALARSAEQVITERVQKELAGGISTGITADDIEKAIQGIGNFTRAYADTVFRTNASTAYTNGRFEQASDPDVSDVIVAFEFVGIRDAFERPNHAAADGLIAAPSDPIWKLLRPPLGFNCRHTLHFISRFEAERRGLWQNDRFVPYYPPTISQARPDVGFRASEVTF